MVKGNFRIVHEGTELAVKPAGLLVGRAEDADIRLSGGLVSRRHARVFAMGGRLWVEDLGSLNGVGVNGVKISQKAELSHGDAIAVGLSVLTVAHEAFLERASRVPTIPPPPGADGDFLPDNGDEEATRRASLAPLSEREREVLSLIVLGHTQAEIARRLSISVKTVETHRAHVGTKLGCRSRAELVAYAVAAGILRPCRE